MLAADVRRHGMATEQLDEHARESWLWKLDASAKLVGIVAFVVATALLTDLRLLGASLLLSVAFAVTSRVPAGHIARAYLKALPFILIASVSVLVVAGPWRALGMWMRISSCVVALLVLASVTEAYDLFAGMRRLRVPATMTTLLMLTYKFILLLGGESSRMSVARKARGFSGGRSLLDRRALTVLGYSAGMVFVRSFGRADRAYEALRSRGFTKEFPFERKRIGGPEIAFLSWFVATAGLLVALQLGVSI